MNNPRGTKIQKPWCLKPQRSRKDLNSVLRQLRMLTLVIVPVPELTHAKPSNMISLSRSQSKESLILTITSTSHPHLAFSSHKTLLYIQITTGFHEKLCVLKLSTGR